MSDLATCELCNQTHAADGMHLFRIKDRQLIPAGREWQLKAGIRHICRDCGRAVSDPFAEAKEIRRGRGELPDYEVLTGWLGRAPQTWLPALLIRIVELCVIQKVFQDGGLEKCVARSKEQAGNPLRK